MESNEPLTANVPRIGRVREFEERLLVKVQMIFRIRNAQLFTKTRIRLMRCWHQAISGILMSMDHVANPILIIHVYRQEAPYKIHHTLEP
jgi:hypothetical protein